MKNTFSVVTLGCKTNQFESVSMQEKLVAARYRQVPFEAGADLVIVNTCTVTAATDAQSRNLIRRARRQNPDCRVIVTGCYAQVDPAAMRDLPGVSVVLGNDDKKDLIRYLEVESIDPLVAVSDIQSVTEAVPHAINSFSERSRAFVQIQNGCNAYCSYCIIPYARGKSRSAEPDQVIEQVARLSASGYPEIVLTGIHIGGYGADLTPSLNLATLLERLQSETGVTRLRLGSIEPNEISADLIDTITRSHVICPHLHIPLQSGDDDVLKRMNRHYTSADFCHLVDTLQRSLPGVALGLDVITGFPGETVDEFENTCRLIENLPVAYLHVFPFSRRPGTPAAGMSAQVAVPVARERAAVLRALSAQKQARFTEGFIGREVQVVVQSPMSSSGVTKGLTAHYLPVVFTGELPADQRLARVLITDGRAGTLQGELQLP